MKATHARELKVGDVVKASFAGYVKPAEIVAIDWPRFTLKVKFADGKEHIRQRNYHSLISKHAWTFKPEFPEWLTFTNKESDTND